MAIAITRTSWTDDDGSGTTGTILNNAAKTELYDQIDAVLNGARTANLLFTDATYDIGASGATRPRDLFLSRNAVVGGTLTAAGDVGLAATKKLYLDGVAMTGDTYIVESAGNTLSLYSGGVESKLTSGVLTVPGVNSSHTFGTASTSYASVKVTNTGGNIYLGIDNSTAGYFQTGGNYAGQLFFDGSAGLSIAAVHASGAIRFYSGGTTERGSWTTAGNLMVGRAAETGVRLSVTGEDATSGAYALFLRNTTPATLMYVRNDAYGYLNDTAWHYSSDRRLKSNIRYFDEHADLVPESVLTALRPAMFNRVGGVTDALGFIAQDVQAVIPSAVSVSDPDTGMLALTTEYVTPYLVAGWQSHDAELSALRARVAELEAKIALHQAN